MLSADSSLFFNLRQEFREKGTQVPVLQVNIAQKPII
jgi:hypothetical protein